MTADKRPAILVNSGAYVSLELFAEFGALPPAFLPVGLDRLYELQAQMLAPLGGDLYLTLPESFRISPWDVERLEELGFTVIPTPDRLNLGTALLHALGRSGFRDRPLRILHGDTLIWNLDLERDDVVAIAPGGDGYRWGQATLEPRGGVEAIYGPDDDGAPDTGNPRLCGYFAFGNAARFAEKLAISGSDFYGALNRYAAECSLGVVSPGRWLDFGHVQTFFQSRRVVTTERSFNSLEIGEMRVRKRSAAKAKVRGEARWLREAPAEVAPFCARVLDEGEDEGTYFYDTEYEYMPTLAELYVFGRVKPASWSRILGSCGRFIEAARSAGERSEDMGGLGPLVVTKTASRLDLHAKAAGLDLDAPNTLNGRPAPSLRRCLHDIEETVAGAGDLPSVMHGDFGFSNILYNFRTDRIRLIDPRALDERGDYSLYGDTRYDLAKLMHSICGRYDMIMAGHYTAARTGAHAFELDFPSEPWRLQVEERAKATTLGGVALGSRVVSMTMLSLFLSMPPLHADRPERQVAFVANALRLHRAADRLP